MSRDVLFLDDDPKRHKKFKSNVPYAEFVYTADQCIKQLRKNSWDVVFLDHDLGGEIFCDPNGRDTGMEVVRWVQENNPDVGKFVIHTGNHLVRDEMMDKLTVAGYRAEAMPFWDLENQILIHI